MAINPITVTITPLDEVTPSNTPTYYQDIADRNNELVTVTFVDVNSLVVQQNTMADQMNATAVEVEANAQLAQTSANIASAGVEYKGDWVAGYNITGYDQNMSVTYTDGFSYRSKINNNLIEPTSETNTTEWDFIEAVSPAQLALKANKANPIFTGIPVEQVSVSTLTLGATSSIQTYTGTADFTIVDDLVSGESVELHLTNAGWTPTYPTITWVSTGQVAPTLNTTDILEFKKVGTTLYGKHTGIIA